MGWLDGYDPWAYLRDVLERLPSHPNSRIDELLAHRWKKPDAWQRPGVNVAASKASRGGG
jgi:hypothetical protein